ncbi:MAG: guanylate kinase [Pseudomonadota bacterium]
MYFARRGLMLVISSPSGAGKTTLAKKLISTDIHLEQSISVTTRPARAGERNGVDYYFVSKDEYKRMIAEDEFLEHAIVHDNGYGTPKNFVEETLTQGKDIIFDIDWQGAQQLRHNVSQDLVTVFILPPSGNELRRRLEGRATDETDVVEKRLSKAASEISHWGEYDYILINDDPESCAQDLKAILGAERLRRRRQTGITEFVRELNTTLK